jgi:hypothetical protein
MLQRARRSSASAVEGRFMIETTHRGRPWVVIVEPDADERILVIVTVYESRPPVCSRAWTSLPWPKRSFDR